MGGASRFILLLTTPFTLLHSRPSLFCLARRSLVPLSTAPHLLTLSPASRPRSLILIKASQQIHTQSNTIKEDLFGDSISFSPNPRALHPWPEWSKLVDTLSARGYFDLKQFSAAEGHGIGPEDAYVAYEALSAEFVRAANACLAFARDRLDILGYLSRRDIEVIVENGTPFLFKAALDTARKMRSFLGCGGANVMESDKAQTVDLMKYVLSYASNPTVSSERINLYGRELIEPSVRNLLSELAVVSCGVPVSNLSAPEQYQISGRHGQTSRPPGQNIEMKRGDWICPKCSFMNFARNVKCLECEEPRPKRQLTGGEWDCPQCDFFNYGRNLVCLRCDCKRPSEASFGAVNSRSRLGYNNGDYVNKADVDSRLAANEEKAQRWFSKVSQLNNTSDLTSAATDEDFPEIMPLRKGVNRFVVSTRKTPLERRLAESQYQRNDGTPGGYDSQTEGANKTLDTSISQSLDQILGHASTVSGTETESITDGRNVGFVSSTRLPRSGSPQHRIPMGSNSSYVPFVPLPADMFAKKPQHANMKDTEKAETESFESLSSEAHDETGPVSVSDEPGKSGESIQLSENPSTQADSLVKEKEEAEKSERWFKRVAELHDVTDLTSAISDEDFPETMPMRKGVNKFVLSKKKDHSLTSPMCKRQMAVEQASNTKFVPFVPFPPDYFAKKVKQQPDSTDSTIESADGGPSSGNVPEKSNDARLGVVDVNRVQRMENHKTGSGYQSSKFPVDFGAPSIGNPIQNSSSTQTISNDSWSSRYSGKENTSETTNLAASTAPQQPENQNVKSEWMGKSLEGSAVKEPDPLDMSEEAKAERWFRRVAQIKDISELSQIPDEDFPSIMPMRKGVNRFVVSKRKTPLERRLTSPQYRKNLPIVRSDPVKTESDSS